MDCVNSQEQWESTICLMELELEILETYNRALVEMRASLHAKDWPALELALKGLNNLAGDLEDFESRRQTLGGNLVGSFTGEEFGEVPDGLQRRFNILKFELKASLLRARSRIHGIAAYAESRDRLTRELVEILVPSARGRIYNERGQTAPTSGNPLVVSHNL